MGLVAISHKRFLIAAFAALVSSRCVWALTWEDAVHEAAQRNPDLAAERAAVEQAQANYKATLAPFMPTLNGSLSVQRTDAEHTSPVDLYDSTLEGRYNLFNGLADTATRAQSRAALDQAVAQYRDIASDISQQVKSAFARLLYAQNQLSLSLTILDRRRENLRLVQLRYEGGDENKGSYLRTKADFDSALFDVNQSSRTLRGAQREMNRAMGRPGYDVLVASGPLQTQSMGTLPNFDALALQTPGYREIEAQRVSAESGVTLARAGFIPAVDASALGARTASTWPPDRDRWAVGATVSIPIFSGGSTLQNVKRAQAARRQATFTQTSTQELIARQLEDAYTAYLNALENVTAQNEYVIAAEVRAQIARGQYANGLSSFFDWDSQESELISRQKSQLAAFRDALLAEAVWENTLGTGAIQP